MKTIRDFTHEELLTMDDAAIERQVKLECAQEGVRMLPVPIKPKAQIIEKRDFYFEIPGTSIKSRSEEPLKRILEAVEKERSFLIETDYSYKYGFSDYYVKGHNSTAFSIEKKHCFIFSDLEARADLLAKQKQEKDEYDQLKKAYDSEQKKVDSLREDILETIYSAKRLQQKIDDLKYAFNEYLDLAKGDEDVAFKFFMKAYGELDEKYINPVIGHLLQRPAEAQALPHEGALQ